VADARGYGSPAAFRRALTDKLKSAANESRWTLAQLQRQIAYDRLLERLYLVDQGWIVKGATALLAREIGVRATIDIDVYRGIAAEVAERELRDAATKDIGDWFRFEVGPARVGPQGGTLGGLITTMAQPARDKALTSRITSGDEADAGNRAFGSRARRASTAGQRVATSSMGTRYQSR
jgi:hypothetical protein